MHTAHPRTKLCRYAIKAPSGGGPHSLTTYVHSPTGFGPSGHRLRLKAKNYTLLVAGLTDRPTGLTHLIQGRLDVEAELNTHRKESQLQVAGGDKSS